MMNANQLIEHARQHRTDAPTAGDILTKATLAAVLRELLQRQLDVLGVNARQLADAAPAVQTQNGPWIRAQPLEPDPRHDSVASALAALISRVEDLK